MSAEPANLCLQCTQYNTSCKWGQDTKSVGCIDFTKISNQVPKTVDGLIPLKVDSIRISTLNDQRIIILKEETGERYLSVWVGPLEADSIAVSLQGVSVPRPLTHDFVCSIVNALGGTVKQAIINKLWNDTFYAKIVISVSNKNVEIDCRPCDAFAIAVRLGIPIFADAKVLNEAGRFLKSDSGDPAALIRQEKIIAPTSRFESFSSQVQDILDRSESEAKLLNQSFVNTGHLLLALLKEFNMATEVLRNLGVNLANLSADAETSLTVQPGIEGDEPGLTSSVKNTILLSLEEAKHLGSDRVGPEHVLIGLIREKDGMAAKLLNNLTISPEKIYIELIRFWHVQISFQNKFELR